MDNFAECLVKARLKAGMNQEDLAAASGISSRTISRIECGDVTPSCATVASLKTCLLDKSQE